MSLFLNILSGFVLAFLPRSKCFNFMAAVNICSDLGALKSSQTHFALCLITSQPHRECTGERCSIVLGSIIWAFHSSSEKPFPLYKTYLFVHAKLLQSCTTLCDPMDWSLPNSSVHGIIQTRVLEWVTMVSSRGPSWPQDWTCVSWVSCIVGRFFTHWATWEAHICCLYLGTFLQSFLDYSAFYLSNSWVLYTFMHWDGYPWILVNTFWGNPGDI